LTLVTETDLFPKCSLRWRRMSGFRASSKVTQGETRDDVSVGSRAHHHG